MKKIDNNFSYCLIPGLGSSYKIVIAAHTKYYKEKWHKIMFCQRLAKIVNQYLVKDSSIYIDDRNRWQRYKEARRQKKEQEVRYEHKIYEGTENEITANEPLDDIPF